MHAESGGSDALGCPPTRALHTLPNQPRVGSAIGRVRW